MAQSQKIPCSIEMRAFVKDLYNYVFSQHEFRTPGSIRILADLNRFVMEEHVEDVESPFSEPIGKAVVHTQYLLREYCNGLFRQIEPPVIPSGAFKFAVYPIVNTWIKPKKNVFIKFISAAAMIAEAILFCDAETEVFRELYEANEMFIEFFERKLSIDFYASGGWLQLQELVLDKYSLVDALLKPYIKRRKNPYQKLDYNCYLIKRLRTGFIQFPVSVIHICEQCEDTSDDMYGAKFDSSQFKSNLPIEFSSLFETETRDDQKESTSDSVSKTVNKDDEASVIAKYSIIFVLLGNEDKETFESMAKREFINRKKH